MVGFQITTQSSVGRYLLFQIYLDNLSQVVVFLVFVCFCVGFFVVIVLSCEYICTFLIFIFLVIIALSLQTFCFVVVWVPDSFIQWNTNIPISASFVWDITITFVIVWWDPTSIFACFYIQWDTTITFIQLDTSVTWFSWDTTITFACFSGIPLSLLLLFSGIPLSLGFSGIPPSRLLVFSGIPLSLLFIFFSGIPLSLDTCCVIWFVGYRRRLSLLLLSLGYVHYFVPGYLFYGSFTYEEYVTGHCRVLVQSLDRVTPNSVASGSAMLAHRQLSPKRIATPSGQVPPLTGLEVVYERHIVCILYIYIKL